MKNKQKKYHKPFWPLDRNFFVCRLISLLAFVIVNCRAKGENSTSLSLHSPWNSLSPSPLIVRSTNALALRRWVLKRPLIEVTNPSPAPSVGRLGQVIGRSDFPSWLASLSLKLSSSGTPVIVGSFWLFALSLNFLPYTKEYWNFSKEGVRHEAERRIQVKTVPLKLKLDPAPKLKFDPRLSKFSLEAEIRPNYRMLLFNISLKDRCKNFYLPAFQSQTWEPPI